MEKDLSRIIRGFKTGCNRSYRELVLGVLPVSPVPSVALPTQQTGLPTQKKDRRGEDRTHGLLFARGFNDKLLTIRRDQCLALNELSRMICQEPDT